MNWPLLGIAKKSNVRIRFRLIPVALTAPHCNSLRKTMRHNVMTRIMIAPVSVMFQRSFSLRRYLWLTCVASRLLPVWLSISAAWLHKLPFQKTAMLPFPVCPLQYRYASSHFFLGTLAHRLTSPNWNNLFSIGINIGIRIAAKRRCHKFVIYKYEVWGKWTDYNVVITQTRMCVLLPELSGKE